MEDAPQAILILAVMLFLGGLGIGYHFKDKHIPTELIIESISKSEDGIIYLELEGGFTHEATKDHQVGDILILTKKP